MKTLALEKAQNERVAQFVEKYYYSKENDINKIKLDKTINSKQIHVTSDCTSFININLSNRINLEKLLNDFKIEHKKLVSAGVKTKGYNKVLKLFRESSGEYELMLKKQNTLFQELSDIWTNLELYMGCSNDYEYNYIALPKKFEFDALQRSNTLEKFYKLFNLVEELKRTNREYTSITYMH